MPWTPEEDEILKRDDLTDAEAAERLGRTLTAVAVRRRQLKKWAQPVPPVPVRRWSPGRPTGDIWRLPWGSV